MYVTKRSLILQLAVLVYGTPVEKGIHLVFCLIQYYHKLKANQVTAKVPFNNIHQTTPASQASARDGSQSRPASPVKSRPTSPSKLRPVSPTKLSPLLSLSPPPLPVVRPKAKVNSSAKIGGASSNRANTLHANSPVTSQSRSGAFSPPSPSIKARVTRTVPTPSKTNAPSSPSVFSSEISRQQSLTYSQSEVSPRPAERKRHGSVSLHHASSFSSLHSRTPSLNTSKPSLETFSFPEHKGEPSSLRIKAKVSGLTKGAADNSPSPSPSTHGVNRSFRPRSRPPSISQLPFTSMVSASSPPKSEPVFYPITTAVPAANPHRYTQSRPAAIRQQHTQSPPSSNEDTSPKSYGSTKIVARVDPMSIPLPPQSPPTSSLSFSSQSSMSHSATSADSKGSIPTVCSYDEKYGAFKSSLNGLVLLSGIGMEEELASPTINGHHDDDLDSSDRKVKAEAKSNRKVNLTPRC
jgi:hypothetical protein